MRTSLLGARVAITPFQNEEDEMANEVRIKLTDEQISRSLPGMRLSGRSFSTRSLSGKSMSGKSLSGKSMSGKSMSGKSLSGKSV